MLTAEITITCDYCGNKFHSTVTNFVAGCVNQFKFEPTEAAFGYCHICPNCTAMAIYALKENSHDQR